MSQVTLASKCAQHLHSEYYPNDNFAHILLSDGIKALQDASQIWNTSATFTSAVRDTLLDHIRDATLPEQHGLSFLITHCLGDSKWYDRDDMEDAKKWNDQKFFIIPLVWIFGLNPADLLKTEWPEIQFLLTAQNQWRVANDKDQAQKTRLKQLALALKEWGAMMEHYKRPIDVSTSPA